MGLNGELLLLSLAGTSTLLLALVRESFLFDLADESGHGAFKRIQYKWVGV